MTKNALTLLSFLIVSCFAQAQKLDTVKLDQYFKTLEQNNKFMGSVAVSQNGKITYTKSIGFSNAEEKIKADKNTKYRIGSISKTFTAVLVMKAVEEKKLDLNQSIQKFFPAITHADQITIKTLLSHRSGIANFTDDKDYQTWDTQPRTEAEMVALIAKGGSDFQPDSKAKYSNSNYVLLSFILEKTYKQSYAALLKSKITKPQGLECTYFGGKINTANNEAFSYSYEGQWKKTTETDMSIPMGAGGIVSSPTDLVKFSDALFSGKILKRESIALMETIRDNYGMGLFSQSFFDKKGYGHNGGIDRFTSVFTYFPDDHVSFALTSNGSDYNGNEVALTVLSAVYNKPFEIPDFSTYTISAEDLLKYTGTYSSKQIPIKLTITSDGKNLIGQATGQSPLQLEASANNTFRLIKAGIVLEFNPEVKTLLLKQGGGQFSFTKE